jgi:hypothetical protein
MYSGVACRACKQTDLADSTTVVLENGSRDAARVTRIDAKSVQRRGNWVWIPCSSRQQILTTHNHRRENWIDAAKAMRSRDDGQENNFPR